MVYSSFIDLMNFTLFHIFGSTRMSCCCTQWCKFMLSYVQRPPDNQQKLIKWIIKQWDFFIYIYSYIQSTTECFEEKWALPTCWRNEGCSMNLMCTQDTVRHSYRLSERVEHITCRFCMRTNMSLKTLCSLVTVMEPVSFVQLFPWGNVVVRAEWRPHVPPARLINIYMNCELRGGLRNTCGQSHRFFSASGQKFPDLPDP